MLHNIASVVSLQNGSMNSVSDCGMSSMSDSLMATHPRMLDPSNPMPSSNALSSKQREVSDVLKSLTVLDLDGGTVSAVSYDSTTPVEQLLAEIALSIPDDGSLVGLLPQIKGAKAAVKPTGGAAVQGVILGI